MASSVSPEKTLGRVSLTVLVLVEVDMGFAGGGTGLAGGCDGGTVDEGAKIDGVVVGMTENTVITRGVTGVMISFLSHVFFLISIVRCPYFSFAPSYKETNQYLLAFPLYSSPLMFLL